MYVYIENDLSPSVIKGHSTSSFIFLLASFLDARCWLSKSSDPFPCSKQYYMFVCLSSFLPHRNSSISTWPVCTRHKYDFIPFSIDSRCLLQIGDESPDICICSLSSPPPHIYVSKCVYVYVHISLFLPDCACTTIIDISPRIFSLMYCCVSISIIIVICICPPGALVNKLISIYWKCNATDVMYFIFINQEACFSCKFVIINII